MSILLFPPARDCTDGGKRRIDVHSRQVVGDGVERAADMANKKIERLHVHAPADDLGNLAGFDPHQVVVVSLEDELFTPKKVIITLDTVIASKAFLLDS